MKSLAIVGFAAVLLSPATLWAQVTLDEMLDRARENAAVLREHDAKVDKARWQKYRADWAAGPKLRSDTALAPVPAEADPDSFGSNVDELIDLDIGPYVRQKLSVVVPLYTFGRIDTAQALAELGLDVARLERRKAALNLEYEVRRAFFTVQLATSFGALLEEGGKLIKDKLVEMEEAREFGDADFDVKDFRKLQVFDAEIDGRVVDNAQLRDIAAAGLRYFTRFEGEVVVQPLDEDGPLPALETLAEVIRVAQEHRPDLALLTQAVRARELQLRLERRNAWPNLFFGAELGLGWSTENPALTRICRKLDSQSECLDTDDLFARPFSNPLNFFTFGLALGLRWDFDYWQQRGKVREVRAQNDEVLAQRERARGAIAFEIEKIWTDARSALDKVHVTARRLEAARRWRDQFGLSLESGGGDMKDAVDPLRAYFEARVLHLQARYDYLVARAALAQAVGLAELPAPVNQSSEPTSKD